MKFRNYDLEQVHTEQFQKPRLSRTRGRTCTRFSRSLYIGKVQELNIYSTSPRPCSTVKAAVMAGHDSKWKVLKLNIYKYLDNESITGERCSISQVSSVT